MGVVHSSDLGFDNGEGSAGWGPDFHLTDPLLLEFVDVVGGWMSSRPGPDEARIDLLDAVRFLPHVVWYEYSTDERWLGRFLGTEIVAVRGDDASQKLLNENSGSDLDERIAILLEMVVNAREPVSIHGQSVIEDREYLSSQSVAFPVFASDGAVSGVIGAQVFCRPESDN